MNYLCDMHCHIVPGVDDGADTMKTAYQILRREERQGVRRIIVTPHFRKHMFETPREEVQDAFEALQDMVDYKFQDMELFLGCELHAYMGMENRIKEPLYRMNGTRYVLLEFSENDPEDFIRERTSTVVRLGCIPILAHIERYIALVKRLPFVQELAESGALLQVNADSVLGLDGFWKKQFTHKLLANNLVNFIGSDAHDVGERTTHIGDCAALVEKKFGTDYAYAIFVRNPERMMN